MRDEGAPAGIRQVWLGDAVVFLSAVPADLRRRLARAPRPPEIRDVVAGMRGVALYLADPAVPAEAVERFWRSAAEGPDAPDAAPPSAHRFAVRYGGPGTDEEELSERLDMPFERIAALHAGAVYTVELTGFAPGFAYLGELPPALRLPRRKTPRQRVEAGAVAMAHRYTGIYPRAAAGGWWLLGHVDAAAAESLWSWERDRPGLLALGDRVEFYSL